MLYQLSYLAERGKGSALFCPAVGGVWTGGWWGSPLRRPNILHMAKLIRIVDGEEDSLERRIAALLAEHQDYVVARFTHWYTARPPLYEAVLHAPRLTARERGG